MSSVVPQTPYNEYPNVDGSTSVFPYEYQLLSAGDLVVTVDGVVVPTSEFVLTGVGNQGGGDVTFNTPPAAGSNVLLSREIALERGIDYQYNGALREKTVDLDFNRLWQALQGFFSRLSGAIRLPYPEQAAELPPADQRKGKFLGFDSLTGAVTLVTGAANSAIALGLALASSIGASLIGYIAFGVGALTRTLQEKLRELGGTAEDFGANGVSNTADILAIQKAAAAAVSAGGVRRLRINQSVSTVIDLSSLGLPTNLIIDDQRYLDQGWGVLHGEGTDVQFLLRGRATPLGEGAAFTMQNLSSDGNRNNSVVSWYGPTNSPVVSSFEHWGYNSPTAVSVTFSASVGGATSGTLTAPITNGVYTFVFSNGDQRKVTVSGGTTCAWVGAITAGAVTMAQPYMWHAGREWLGRGSFDNGFRARQRWGPDGGVVFNPTGTPVSYTDNPTVGFSQDYVAVFNAPVQSGYTYSGKNLLNVKTQAVEVKVDLQLQGANAATRYQSALGVNHWAAIDDFPSVGQWTKYDHRLSVNALTLTSGGDTLHRGTFKPSADNAYSCGTVPNRWTFVAAATGTITTSDRDAKTLIGRIPDAVLDVYPQIEWVRFKLKDSVAEKGEDAARWHFGVIAQQVHEVFAAAGTDAFEFGLLCYDEWDEQWIKHPAIYRDTGFLHEDGTPIQVVDIPARNEKVRDAGHAWSVRYDELQALKAAYDARALARLATPTP